MGSGTVRESPVNDSGESEKVSESLIKFLLFCELLNIYLKETPNEF